MSTKINKPVKDPAILKALQFGFTYFSPIFPTLMGNLCYKLWFTPGHFRIPNREKAIAAKAKKSILTINGQQIPLWSWGEGPVILFLHGWGGRGTQVSAFVNDLQQSGFRIVALDLPAHGQASGKTTDIFQVSEVVMTVAKQFAPLHGVLTHSFGAIVFGVAAAINDVIIPKHAVFLSAPAGMHTPLNNFQQKLHLSNKTKQYLVDKLQLNYGNDIFDKLSVSQKADKLKMPLLLIHDEDDLDVPMQDALLLDEALSNATLMKTKGLGHVKILFDDEVIRSVSEFFNTASI